MSQVITEDGEIVETALAKVETSLATQLARVEIDSLISTARAYPRSLAQVQRRILTLATMDEVTAAECTYAVPRDGKTVEGPSIRFAEIVAQSFGNARIAARTTAIDKTDKFVEAEGVFLDCETNVATLARNRRRISTKAGKIYSDDMILTTCNAAQSIARRNAILSGVPKSVWRQGHEAARHVIMGDVKTLANRRTDAVSAFTRFGLTAEQVFLIIGVKGMEDIDQERLVPLRAIFSQLRNEEITVEELLKGANAAPQTKPQPPNPLKDDEPAQDAKSKKSSAEGNAGHPEDHAAGQQPSVSEDSPATSRTGNIEQDDKAQETPASGKDNPADIPTRSESEQMAYDKGAWTFRNGHRRAVPVEWRNPLSDHLGHAFIQGYDEEKRKSVEK